MENTTKPLFPMEFTIGGETYIYDINRLSARRILQSRQLFQLQNKMELNLPATADEVRILAAREAEAHAFAAILVKVTKNDAGEYTSFAPYDPFAVQALNPLDGLQGMEELNKLWKCKDDFFTHTGLHLSDSLLQLPDLTRQLASLEDREMVREMLAAAVKLGLSSGENAETPTSTPPSGMRPNDANS